MNKQPEALRLAAHAEANAFFGDMELIAAELRRLHEVNAELLEALKEMLDGEGKSFRELYQQARAAIAKAEGGAA
jgi:hypothetical protein